MGHIHRLCCVGAAVMFIIGINYHYLMVIYPDAGGTLTYSIRAFGFDYQGKIV